MKKGQLIHTDNLILRIIVTFLGTFGAASIIETITYPLADMGFIGFVSLIFSVVYTFMLSCYGKNARLIRIMGMAVLPVVYLVINIGSFINGITTFINVFISRASFTGPVDSSNVLTVESAGAASVRCVCVVVIIIIAVLAALEVNVFPNMLVSLAITMPLLSVFIAAVIVPDIISIIFCVLFIFDSMALRNKKIKTNQGAKTAVIISAVIAAVLTFIIPQETYKRNSFFDDARNMVTDVVYDRFGIDLQGNKSETEDDKAKVNATVGIGNGDVGQVDEVYYGNVYAGELNTMSDIGIAYAKVFMGRDFKNNSWQRWSDTRETQYSYESAVSEFALNLVKRKIYTLDEDEQLLADRFFYYQQTFRSKDGNVYGSSLDYRIARGSFEDYSRMGQLMKKYRNSAIVNSYESYAHGQYLDVSDCKLQEGSMRADVNLSVREVGSETFGTRTEMKNLNSFKAIARAIEGERERQIELIEEGRAVVQETRRWDDNKESSHAMRSKEDAKDYRYFPDPDLPPIHISDAWIEELRESQPELREEKQLRYQSEYDLPAYDAGILTESRHLSMLFEEVAKLCGSPKKAANWFMGEVLRLTKDKGMDVEKVSFTPEHLADLIQMVEKKEVSAQNAKKVFEKVFEEDIDPVSYIEEHGLKIVEDTGLLNDTLQKILEENPGPLEELLGGKEKIFGFFVGKMMRELKGKASPDAVREALVKEVEKRKNQ